MKDSDCVRFLQWALPRLNFRWPGFRKVRSQVCKRIDRRIRELDLPDLASYREYLDRSPEEWAVLDRFCRISISRFYRDRGVFDDLRDTVLPELAGGALASGDRVLRCWSAGCASGEEPYTLRLIWKICLQARFPGLLFSIIATDSDPHMLERARQACYASSSLKDLPPKWDLLAFEESDLGTESMYCLRPDFRDGIEWICQDIRDSMPAGHFHLILCRHLAFTYFDLERQQRILDLLISKLSPGGFLVTGKQEQIEVETGPLRPLQPQIGIYRKTV